MVTIRNLAPRMVSFDLPALGTQPHRGGVNALDPHTGMRGFKPHVRHLPRSITLAACHNPRAPLSEALRDGSAQGGLPDEVQDDPTVKALVAKREMWIQVSEPEPPKQSEPVPVDHEVTQ